MTPAEFIAFVNDEVEIKWPFQDWNFRVTAKHADGYTYTRDSVEIFITGHPPHRDTGLKETLTAGLAQVNTLHYRVIERFRKVDAARFIHRCLLGLVEHELDESFHVAGERIFDPHAQEQT